MGKSTSEGNLPQIEAAALGKGSSDLATLVLLPMPLTPQIPEGSNQELFQDQIPWALQLLGDFAGRSSSPALQAGWHSSTLSCSFIYLSTKSLILLQLQCRGRPQSEQNPAVMGCSHPTFPGADSGTEVAGGCRAAHGCC